MRKIFDFQKGFSIVELLITIGLAAILFPALLTGFVATRNGRAQGEERLQAIHLVEEAQEAVRVIRESGWKTLTDANCTSLNPCYPEISESSWKLNNGTDPLSGSFTRTITISDVSRDTNGVIVDPSTPGATPDPSTKKILITVSWGSPISASVNTTEYVTRYGNESAVDTTQTDFQAGTYGASIAITNINGGEVTLGPSISGDWCQPTQSITQIDLSRQGVPTSVWSFEMPNGTENRVFAGTGGNASGPTFTNTKIVGNNPPTPTSLGEFNDTKANGVFGDGNFAYLATDSNSQEIIILDLNQFTDPPTNSKYKEVGWFNAPGSTDANSVFVLGSSGYMTAGNKFYTFDLSSKLNDRGHFLDQANLAGEGVKVFVVGSYAYVAISGSNTKMQIVDVTDPNHISIKSSLTLNSQDARDIFVNSAGNRAYLATVASANQDEFFIISTTDKLNPTLVSGGTFDTGGMDPQGVTVVSGGRAIIVGKNGSAQHPEYQVIDITHENTLTPCGVGLSVTGGINAISSVMQSDGHAYSYIVTGDPHGELKIIEGGSGAGGLYTLIGTFQSRTLPVPDPGHDVAFNSFSVNQTVAPPVTSIDYQVAIKPDINGSCTGVVFDNFLPYTPPKAFPLGTTGQCLRYKAILSTTDPNQTPVLSDITFNYSP